MSNNTEPTSNSTKFVPMPMSALLASLAPLQNKSSTPDSSFSSADNSDNDNSFFETVTTKKTAPHNHNKKDKLFTADSKEILPLTANNRLTSQEHSNKENQDYALTNNTYPSKYGHSENSAHNNAVLSKYPSSERKRNVLLPLNNQIKNHEPSQKRTPVIKVLNSNQKLKTPTPKIKTGIRRFTPSSIKKSQKKTPQKYNIEPSKETHRRLFAESHEQPVKEACPPLQNIKPVPETPLNNKQTSQCSVATPSYPRIFPESHKQPVKDICPPPQVKKPVPETPLNNKQISQSSVATPSYPQGGTHSKVQYKTTVIKGKKYMYIKKLGAGGSSEVYKVLEVSTSCEYAIKCVDLETDQQLAQGYFNEVRLLRDLQDSDRVIRLYDYEYDRTNHALRIVLEVGETDLSSLLKARGAGLPPALVLHYWEEMLLAVNYIHQRGVIHADLKPANFLLVCGRLKLIDFGIASSVNSDATSVELAHAAGTFSYISPEALSGGAGGLGSQPADGAAPIKISFRSDVWSLGCILYSMVYGKTPFAHIPNFGKLAAILDPNHRIDYPPVEHHPALLLAALQWCLTYNMRARPTVQELLSIKYLQPAEPPPPHPLLERLRPHLTPDELRLLQKQVVAVRIK